MITGLDLASLKAGLSEEWLCSLFGNLPEDLCDALRAAYVSSLIVHKHNMTRAETSTHNRMRYAIGSIFGRTSEAEVSQLRLGPPRLSLNGSTAGSAVAIRRLRHGGRGARRL